MSRQHAPRLALYLWTAALIAGSAAGQSHGKWIDSVTRVESREIQAGVRYSRYVSPIDERFNFFRTATGPFDTEAAAGQALKSVERSPVPLTLDRVGARFRWISPRLENEETANLVLAHLRFAGLAGGAVIYDAFEQDEATGPHDIHVLELQPDKVRLQPARALDEGLGLETVSSICRRYAALAGVNAGYFRTTGTYRGESEGVYVWNGQLISKPNTARSAVGFEETDGRTRLLMGRVTAEAWVRLGTASETVVNGINRPRGANELIVYTPAFHRTTLTDAGGLEVVVTAGRVTAVRDGQGSAPIPAGGYVLSAAGEAARIVRQLARDKVAVAFRTHLAGEAGSTEDWNRCPSIVGAGPRLLAAGSVVAGSEPESRNPAFFGHRHPRTAVGVRPDGSIVLVVVDGRQWKDGIGLTIPQMADWMLSLGCRDALNLDGGGSSALVINDRLMNHPSDAGGERLDSDALLVFPRGK